MRIGLLLPHFGPSTSYERLFGLADKLAGTGFSSVWVRDQLGFEGGMSFEPRSNHFVDPFIALAAIAAKCDLRVGTATLTPIRQPLVLAQLVGSLSYLSKGRLVLGVGLGGDPRAFELAGLRFEDRNRLFEDMINVLRATASPNASFEGHFVRFREVSLDPAPPADLTIWYCGSSVGATRRAVQFASGWFPGRCPFRVFDRLLAELREHAAKDGMSPRVAVVPIVSVDKTREAALAKVNVQGLLADARSKRAWRMDGPFETADDLAGALIVGPPEDVAGDLKALDDRGVDEVVIDLRLRMDRFDETVELLDSEVLPLLQRGTP